MRYYTYLGMMLGYTGMSKLASENVAAKGCKAYSAKIDVSNDSYPFESVQP